MRSAVNEKSFRLHRFLGIAALLSSSHNSTSSDIHIITERFCVLRGKAKIDLRKLNTDEVISYVLDGDKTQYIDMPLYYVHNITPADDNEIVVLFWTNELLNESDTDTYHELV